VFMQGPIDASKQPTHTTATVSSTTPSETEYIPTLKELEDFQYNVSLNHRATPMLKGDDALNTIEEQLNAFQKELAKLRPDLAAENWDVTIKDGRLQVTGDMPDEARKYLEDGLNGDDKLVKAVSDYVGAAIDYLQTSKSNPAYHAINGYTNQIQDYNRAYAKAIETAGFFSS
jgi:hypothetical protein